MRENSEDNESVKIHQVVEWGLTQMQVFPHQQKLFILNSNKKNNKARQGKKEHEH